MINQNQLITSGGRGGLDTARITNSRNLLWEIFQTPLYEWDCSRSSSRKQIKIAPIYTNGGDSVIVIPFRKLDESDNLDVMNYMTSGISWTIDVNATGLGGRIDGISLGTESVYWVYAFYNPAAANIADRFVGFGVMRRPVEGYNSGYSGGTKGSTTTFTLTTANRTYAYPVNCRVLVREGTATTSNYNQGTVLSRTSTTITIALDNVSVGDAGGYGSNLNTGNTGSIIQLDNPAPYLPSSDSLYPGGGVEYQYCYMGSLSVDNASDLFEWRHRGDPRLFPDGNMVFYSASGITATTTSIQSAARWLDVRTRLAWMLPRIRCTSYTNGEASLRITTTDGIGTVFSPLANKATTDEENGWGWVSLDPPDGAFSTRIGVVGTNTSTSSVQCSGYIERFW